ncbi:uncharacterized protein CTRU02_206803 [Colletotrichum truncatum]|uniref:Uncharacterized protein n=1 Tax=Colletotrichum truncatum TaxID=5467 RepID=A0ACC3YZ20_COLTU
MFMTLKSSGDGGNAGMVQVASRHAGVGGKRTRRGSSKNSDYQQVHTMNTRASARPEDSPSSSRGCDKCSSCTKSRNGALDDSIRSSLSDNHNHTLATSMDHDAVDATYHRNNLQDVLNLSEAAETLTRSLSPTMPTPTSFDSLLEASESPMPLSLSLDEFLTSDTGSSNGSGACSCTNNLLKIVQQFDDDDFGLTSLSLDEVMKLQKWILFQCCQPLDCPSCQALPAVHTVLLIICDRMTEIFECIEKRIRRTNSQPHRTKGPNETNYMTDGINFTSVEVRQSSGNLFDASTGNVAGQMDCNPHLFSLEFQRGYSDEEQVHMIRVLLKLQIRNFRSLLVRVHDASQASSREARKSKVKSLTTRLSTAEIGIENSLRDTLKKIMVNMPNTDFVR